jgi:hypothetical protein
MSDVRTRNLIFRFWELSSSQRREITQELCLIDNEDMKLPEAERYDRAFQRAKEKGKMDQLADKVHEMEKNR